MTTTGFDLADLELLLTHYDTPGSAGQPRRPIEFRASSKAKIDLELMFIPLKDGNAFVCGWNTENSLSSAKSLDSNESHLLFAAENGEIGLWYWEFGTDELQANANCKLILGLPADAELTYGSFSSSVHPEDRDSVRHFLNDTIRSGQRYEYNFRIISPEGDVEWIAAEGRSFLSGQSAPEKMVGVIRRITDEKRAAAELETVYATARSARDEAEVANRSKDVFLAFVSHELRAPLNAILGWSNILLTKDVDEKTRRNALETIERSARMQTKLINDLVDSARVASGKIRLEYYPIDLIGVVRNAVEAQRPAAENRGLDYRIGETPDSAIVLGDANRLQQVFGNLLSNAIKFTSPGGEVFLEAASNRNEISVSIVDSGEGISSDTLPIVFEQFSQVGSAQDKGVGLGLGLSIAKTLVERHRGSVRAESEGVGKGSRFVVTLPILDPSTIEHPTEKRPMNAKDPLSKITILIVEDEDDSRDILRLHLENLGASVMAADSVANAFKLLDESDMKPHLIISDIGMPEEDGISFITRLRKLENTAISNIPAIALSAFATSDFKANALDSGFQRYVAKPFDPETLTSAVLDHIKFAN
ncbi:MAG: hybrid sensor histidine kinase/response regulator [Pyrinomonadaceae bacterium]